MSEEIKKILVVDDEPAIRQTIFEILSAEGFQVLSAKDGVEALKLVDSSHEAIDALLIDVVMPRLDGTELARVLLSYYPAIKIIFMSGYPDDVISKHGIPASNMRFIKKPFAPDILVKTVWEELKK